MFSTKVQASLVDLNKQQQINKIVNKTLTWNYSLDGYCKTITTDYLSPEQLEQLRLLNVVVKSKNVDLIEVNKKNDTEYVIMFSKHWKMITPLNVIIVTFFISIYILARAFMIH
jgi:hypothetical protein